VGQRVMGWTGHTLGTLLPGSPEDTPFCGYFGLSAEVAVEAWEMMEELDCLPPSPQCEHYLWVLRFMRLYPANNKALSTMLGGSDPKTIQKYIWPMIQSIFDLEGLVVSTADSPASIPSHPSPSLPDSI
jgi:hypothetical protein